MKKIFKMSVLALVMTILFAACKKEDKLNANLDLIDQNTTAPNPIDAWLNTSYLAPYNIEVKYKFDRFELELGKNITPPKEDNIISAMDVVNEVWIKPYETAGGPSFIKRFSPKQFILAGSGNYATDGELKAGTAEAGRKIVLYLINNFDKTSSFSVRGMLQVIHHEYTHILNQTVNFQTDYQLISKGGYLSAYNQQTLEIARSLGFITRYSRKSPEEDFAEMTSNMLMLGNIGFNLVAKSTTADGYTKLKKKEEYVVDYFKTAFNIDFYTLQRAVQNKLNVLLPIKLADLAGTGTGFTTLSSNPSVDPLQSAEFLKLWDAAKAGLKAYVNSYDLKGFTMNFGKKNLVTLTYKVVYTLTGAVYEGSVDYTIAKTGDFYTFTINSTQPTTTLYTNMQQYNTAGITPVSKYFTLYKFRAAEIAADNQGAFGAFYRSDDEKSYFYGKMAM